MGGSYTYFCAVAPLAGGADRNNHASQKMRSVSRRPPRGGADRNVPVVGVYVNAPASPPSRGRGSKREIEGALGGLSGRPPRGGADRNSLEASRTTSRLVAPSRGRGSKQLRGLAHNLAPCRPLAGARIETPTRRVPSCAGACRPLAGGADRNMLPVQYALLAQVAPSRGRGSKPLSSRTSLDDERSPPRGRADRNARVVERLSFTDGRRPAFPTCRSTTLNSGK